MYQAIMRRPKPYQPSRRAPIFFGGILTSFDLTYRAARAAYEANRVYCTIINDPVPVAWSEVSEAQQRGYMLGVQFVIDNPNAGPEVQHEAWRKQRTSEGWRYGPTKIDTLKVHPNMVPYEELPAKQQYKDMLFRAVVKGVCAVY